MICRWLTNCIMLCTILICNIAADADDRLSPSVGAPGLIEEIRLPGPELVGKPIMDKDALVVRVVEATEAGDGFRYRIMFQGLEPGHYDLSNWLIRKDGSSAVGLPPINVEIKSILPPGQIEPNDLEQGWIPRFGGYRRIAAGAAIAWLLVFVYLIFPRKKKTIVPPKQAPPQTLADLLNDRIRAALADQADTSKYAELERMLFGMWRKRLGLEQVSIAEAMGRIRRHDTAGPLMLQLEQWMHRRDADPDVDLATLLDPYRALSPDALESYEESP